AIARVGHLLFGTDGVYVGRVELRREFDSIRQSALPELFQQVGGPIGAVLIDDLIQRFEPLRGFQWIQIHYPLVEFLVHEYSHYNEPLAATKGRVDYNGIRGTSAGFKNPPN